MIGSRLVSALVAVASLAVLPLPSLAAEERGVVVLTDNVWANGARSSIEGRAIVCGLKGPTSFLSLRTTPKSTGIEITKLNEMAIVELTGKTHGKWAQTTAVVYEIAQDGNLLPEANRGTLNISGWVHTDFLCNYMY